MYNTIQITRWTGMQKKNKILIGVSVAAVVALTLGLVLGGLDRLDVQKYGINYNYITANFTDQKIYEGGLNFVGPSNVLLQIPKTYQTISFSQLKTFTNDFFPLQLSVEVRYIVVLDSNNTATQNFTALRSFYVNFSGDPDRILKPLMRNQIIKIGSSFSSSFYRNASNYISLQSQMESSIQSILSKWAKLNVKVLLSSVVSKGVAFNLESLNRKIAGLISQTQRTQARKADMTNFINVLGQSTQIKMNIIKEAILRRTSVVKELNNNQYASPSVILRAVEAIRKNLTFASSELTLRPELYLLKNNSIF